MRHMQSHHNTYSRLYERIHSWRLNIHNSPTRTRRNNRAHDREDQSPRTPFTLASFSCSPGESTRTVLTDMVLSGPGEWAGAHIPRLPGQPPGRQNIQHLINYDIIIINTHHTRRVRIPIQPEQMQLLRTRTFTTHHEHVRLSFFAS
jgi:hypothetical protein